MSISIVVLNHSKLTIDYLRFELIFDTFFEAIVSDTGTVIIFNIDASSMS